LETRGEIGPCIGRRKGKGGRRTGLFRLPPSALRLDPAGNIVLSMKRVQYGGLQAAEAEFEAVLVEERARELVGLRVAELGLAFDGRPAGEAEAEDCGHLVKGFAGRVVAGAAKEREIERPV